MIADVRYALRSFLKTPLFTAIVLLTLAACYARRAAPRALILSSS